MVVIKQYKNPVLRTKSKNVLRSDLGSQKLKKIITDMKTALSSCEDGVAIAAPQIGIPLRIFIVSKKVLGEKAKEDMIFINPKITKSSKKMVDMEEGCLSVRWIYGKVKRKEKTTVSAWDENGETFTRNGSGLMAQIFQHETDHLDGILFIDKATDLVEIDPTDIKNE